MITEQTMTELDDYFLAHYGIKGMKWGVRRPRGPDGTVVTSADHNTSRELKKKRVSELSNTEMRQVTQRLQLEKSYADLTRQANALSKGKKVVAGIIATGAAAQGIYNLVNSPMAKAAKRQVQKALKNRS